MARDKMAPTKWRRQNGAATEWRRSKWRRLNGADKMAPTKWRGDRMAPVKMAPTKWRRQNVADKMSPTKCRRLSGADKMAPTKFMISFVTNFAFEDRFSSFRCHQLLNFVAMLCICYQNQVTSYEKYFCPKCLI